MIRIGFLLWPSSNWMGGINYFKNLLFAIELLGDERLEPVIFVGKKSDQALVDQISTTVQVVRTSLLDRKSLTWICWRVTKRLFGSDFFVKFILSRYRIKVFSHSGIASGKKIRSINWIPDFQHRHLPEFFSQAEIEGRNAEYTYFAEQSDRVVLSSSMAVADFCAFAPAYAGKARLLKFVSQVDDSYWKLGSADEARIRSKYGIVGKFFFLPNQFWKHKNHMTVFKAVSELRQRGQNVILICSGAKEDYRNRDHMQGLREYLAESGADKVVKILGLIPYADVYALIRFSEAVINPSLFEGWSSTVEECRSVGKPMILSDIPVHREQIPGARFFAPHDALELAGHLNSLLSSAIDTVPDSAALKENLRKRTLEFAIIYRDILVDLL